LGIEKARFAERLAVVFDVDASMRSIKVPPMILQPLVENAIKHGIGQVLEGGEVRVRARTEQERIVIVVEDTGPGKQSVMRHRGAGIGLTNVRERLSHIYGDGASCRLEERTEGGMRAVLVLPEPLRVNP
jgi:LytS/YehU family sensor histidine kinase